MIEILLHAVVRIRNLAGPHLDEHFVALNRKEAYISLADGDVKNDHAMMIPRPSHLAHRINF